VIAEKDIDEGVEAEFQSIRNVAHAILKVRADMQLPRHIASAVLLLGKPAVVDPIAAQYTLLQALVPIYTVEANPKAPYQGFCSSTHVGEINIILPLSPELEAKEKKRLAKEHEKTSAAIAALEKQLSNDNFVAHAPQDLVEKKRANLAELKAKQADIESRSASSELKPS